MLLIPNAEKKSLAATGLVGELCHYRDERCQAKVPRAKPPINHDRTETIGNNLRSKADKVVLIDPINRSYDMIMIAIKKKGRLKNANLFFFRFKNKHTRIKG